MPQIITTLQIFKLLDRSNCRQCGKKTCLAFAGAVFVGQKALADCPKLDAETVARHAKTAGHSAGIAQNRDAYLARLKSKIIHIDLAAAARRLGARFAGGRLTLKVLGKDFSVDSRGNLSADIHINPWVAVPFLTYVLYGKGLTPSGRWLAFRELQNGMDLYPIFQKRCEAALQQVADSYTDLFRDMVQIFNAQPVENPFAADISVVLQPLPRVPLMICYQRPEDGFGSSLSVLFDETANRNLDIGAVFSLGTGLTQMFEKLARRHGIGQAMPPYAT